MQQNHKNTVKYSELKRKVAVLWIREVTDDPEMNKGRLEIQEKICRDYAEQNGITIKSVYGGAFQTTKAAVECRKKMVSDVINDDEVNAILLCSFDRFGRDSEEAILTMAYLKSKGVYVISATQQTDPDSVMGEFLENAFVLFSQFENNLHHQKYKRLHKGQWHSKLNKAISLICDHNS